MKIGHFTATSSQQHAVVRGVFDQVFDNLFVDVVVKFTGGFFRYVTVVNFASDLHIVIADKVFGVEGKTQDACRDKTGEAKGDFLFVGNVCIFHYAFILA